MKNPIDNTEKNAPICALLYDCRVYADQAPHRPIREKIKIRFPNNQNQITKFLSKNT